MVGTYKYKSKMATAISFIAAFILYIGKDELSKILPPEYAFLAGAIVLLAGYVYTQSTENTRVDIAEQRILENILAKESDTPETETDVAGDEDVC